MENLDLAVHDWLH